MSGRTPVAVDADGNVRLPVGQVILRAQPRALIVGTVTALAVLMAALVALAWGDYPLSVPQVVQALLSDQGFATRVVTQWRLPRVIAAIAFGAALGASGALFQTLTRNPLGSPTSSGSPRAPTPGPSSPSPSSAATSSARWRERSPEGC